MHLSKEVDTLGYKGTVKTPDSDCLQHWKYIKRERKGNKWVYTYPNDKLGVKRLIDTKVTGKAYKQHAEDARSEKNKTAQDLFTTQQSRKFAEQISKGYSQDDPKVVSLQKKEEQLSKQVKALDKEAAEANRNYRNKSIAGRAESNFKTAKSVVESTLYDAKKATDKVKDKLGADERQEYQEAKTKYETAQEKHATAKNNIKKFNEEHGDDHYKEYPYELANELHWENSYWRERAETRGREYMSAKNEYMKTPLGTALRAKEALADAAFEVSYFLENGLFRKKKKNSK